jgi:pilus assembly protein CpaB
MRAFTVKVNEVVGVAGFAVAGMHVDVLVAGTPPGVTMAGTISRTLLQNVTVLSAGQNYQKDAEGKPEVVQVVNLLVTPAQAEILNLATSERIQLVLRNPADNAITQTSGAATANLFEGGVIHTSGLAFSSEAGSSLAAASRPRRKPTPAAVAVPALPAMLPAPPPPPSIVEVISGGVKTQVVVRNIPVTGEEGIAK